jgi:hypothetical protein
MVVKVEPSFENEDNEEQAEFHNDDEIMEDDPLAFEFDNQDERSCSPSDFLITPDNHHLHENETSFKVEQEMNDDYMDHEDNDAGRPTPRKNNKNDKKKITTSSSLRFVNQIN